MVLQNLHDFFVTSQGTYVVNPLVLLSIVVLFPVRIHLSSNFITISSYSTITIFANFPFPLRLDFRLALIYILIRINRNKEEMCRLAIYIGPPIVMSKFVTEPNHSIIKQSNSVHHSLSNNIIYYCFFYFNFNSY